MADISPRAKAWAQTMSGHAHPGLVVAHDGAAPQLAVDGRVSRQQREEWEAERLNPGAALACGAGNRAIAEEPDLDRTCFERDRDRIVHSAAFRRLAGKTQVVVFPDDHQRTRLTHALEVAQVAISIARGVGANVTLAEAMALGHDCGHGPGGHASEDAFDAYVPGGYDHGPWGADVVLARLNLCAETLDGIRNHSWSRPSPLTVEGQIVSWADRIAYCAHDLEDAISARIITADDVPDSVAQVAGRTRTEQLSAFIRAVISSTSSSGLVSMDSDTAQALADLRAFNYERIYTRPESLAQAAAVVAVLQALVEHYVAHPETLPNDALRRDPGSGEALREAVTYVAGMTDRYAFAKAVSLLEWDADRLPKHFSG